MSQAALDVVIVTARGSRELVDRCVRSLMSHPAPDTPARIAVVDNASRDGTVEWIARQHPTVHVNELARNHGFAAAANIGIGAGRAPFVLVLNPDTEVLPGALERLLVALREHPRAAVAGPRLVGADGRPDHNAKRSFPTPWAALGHFVGLQRPTAGGGYARSDIGECSEGAVDAVSGSCMLVRRAAIEHVGLLDEAYWMYGEDLDWCRRFGQAGWQVRYVGSATVFHLKHGLTGRHRPVRINWAFHRAMGRFYRKFDAGPRPLLDGIVYLGLMLKFGVSVAQSAMSRALSSARRW